ncbi:hypothetical protein A0J61_01399 [Choanephora cucurbitarum]|uniref:Uncharacterized protein n=1 Tax=Choanephora cucurbitarum TaxID=101091 RepID=A0A1C7NQ25_9FUNG|nr:hypothetical protein A0J61_01399 [Choanephora cucurbitarum]
MVLIPVANYSLFLEDQAFPPNETSSSQVVDADFINHAFLLTPCVTGFFIDRGFGQIMTDNHRQLPSTPSRIVVPLLDGYLTDDHIALIFALRLHFYSQAKVIVLQSHRMNESKHYATATSIQQALDQGFSSSADEQDGKDTLSSIFTSTVPSNVILQTVPARKAQYLALLNELESPLEEHDLLIVGRSINRSHVLPTAIPPSPGSNSYHEFTTALGPYAQFFLKGNTKASVIVVQAPVFNTDDV